MKFFYDWKLKVFVFSWVCKFVYFEDGLDCPKYLRTNLNIVLLCILYHIVYLLTYSLHGVDSFLRSKRFSSYQKIPCILWNPKAHYCVHNCSPHVTILSLNQRISQGPRHQFVFCNMTHFSGEELLATHPTPKL